MIEYFHDQELRKNARVQSYETDLWYIATGKILSSQAGKSAPGTSCPPGHSQAFCNGYEYASGGSGTGYTQGVADPTHCDQPGSPACYDVGYHDGYNNAVNEHHQFHTSCPLGAFCTGYVPGYTRQIV
jgi:hypothetical protein